MMSSDERYTGLLYVIPNASLNPIKIQSLRAATAAAASSLEEGAGGLPWGKDDLVDGANGLTGTVVVTGGPLGLSIGGAGLDLSEVRLDGLDGLDLPVGVVLGVLDNELLGVVSGIDILVLGVGVAGVGISDSLWLEGDDGRLDGGPILLLDGGDESIGLVGEGLVGGEAGIELGLEVCTEEGVEDTSLEVGGGGGGNSGVHGGESESGKHCF